MGYTVAQLAQRMRTWVDDFGVAKLPDETGSEALGAYDYVLGAYLDFAERTKCFQESLITDAVEDQGTYLFSDFALGTEGEDEVNTGARVIEPVEVYYNDNPLQYMLAGQMAGLNPQWRSAGSGTPLYWLRRDARSIQVYQAASADGTGLMAMEAYVEPDIAVMDGTDEPELRTKHQLLLAMKAAYDYIVRIPSEANVARAQPLVEMYEAGCVAAEREFRLTRKARIGGGEASPRYRYPITIEGV